MSSPGAEWVSQPSEMMSTPVAAISRHGLERDPARGLGEARPATAPRPRAGGAGVMLSSRMASAPAGQRVAASWSSVSTSTSSLTMWPMPARARVDRRAARRRRRRCGCP